MSKIYKEGKKVKAIGVSNFSEKTLEGKLSLSSLPPAVSSFWQICS
jgi:diketogulonate reductase-like aldo/keto reductase